LTEVESMLGGLSDAERSALLEQLISEMESGEGSDGEVVR
jgi:hypothetical protein